MRIHGSQNLQLIQIILTDGLSLLLVQNLRNAKLPVHQRIFVVYIAVQICQICTDDRCDTKNNRNQCPETENSHQAKAAEQQKNCQNYADNLCHSDQRVLLTIDNDFNNTKFHATTPVLVSKRI